jgi:serine/threonine protein kinase
MKNINRYKILRELGQGGMATVYLGYDVELDRYAAIKVLDKKHYSNSNLMARFKQEARSIAKLKHKHILQIFHFDHDDELELTYIIMPYIEGGTLEDLINRDQQLSFDEIAKILHQIGTALDHAHTKEIIHRDIKPSNILRDEDGVYYLSDFGIAKHLTANTLTLTDINSIIGTPYYMSPEQCAGESENLSGASDFYSLGIVLFQMLTGYVPYEGTTPLKTLHYHQVRPIPDILEYRSDLNHHFQQLFNKLLAKYPSERYQSGLEIWKAFNAAVKTLEEKVSPQDDLEMTIPYKDEGMEQQLHNALLARQASFDPTQPKPLVTAPLDSVSLRITMPERPGFDKTAHVKRSVILQDFLIETCQHLNLTNSRDYTFRLDGRVLDLNGTISHNNIPPKAMLELVQVVKQESPTWKWIRENPHPKPFGKDTSIRLIDEDTRSSFYLRTQPAIIGRNDPRQEIPHINNFLAVDLTHHPESNYVSRQHACITRQKDQYYVESLNERNRTFLNNALLKYGSRYPIQAGARIRVGRITLIFEIH